jgi:hypothetical protein
MPSPQWGFCGGTYVSQSPNIDAEEAINVYCERSESEGAKTPIALLSVPGKKVFATIPEGSVPFLFSVNGRSFAAAANLWELGTPGGPTNRGNLGLAPTTPTQIITNQTQLLILNNGNLYVLTLASNVFVAVNMAQFNGPVSQIDFSDGYGIATIQNSNTIQVSNLEDFTTWQGLNIATISLFPDNIVSMICDHRELWLFSGKKSTVYYNAGAGFPPFIPVQGGFLEDGGGAKSSPVRADNSIFWIAADERGGGIAKRANGYTGQRISTHAVEYAWRQYATIADAVGWTYQDLGHTFVGWYFPSANATWVYDISTGLWHKRGYWSAAAGQYSADRFMSHSFNFGKHLVGDWSTGNIYELNSNFYDDAGQPLRWLRRSPTVASDNKWVYFPEIEIDVEAGLGPMPPLLDGQGNPRDPQIMLRWSDNATKTWSNEYLLNCGQAGQFADGGRRARKIMLGRARKRVWEVSGSDPIPWRIANAYLPGVYEAAF